MGSLSLSLLEVGATNVGVLQPSSSSSWLPWPRSLPPSVRLADCSSRSRLELAAVSISAPSRYLKHCSSIKAHSAITSEDGLNWWEKDGGPNMIDIHSKEEFTETIASVGQKLVVVEFFATWCGSCRALYPRLCKLAAEHMNVLFLKVDFDENKPMCKSMGVRVLPYFHFYNGSSEPVEAFSCSLTKLQRLKDAIATYSIGSNKDENTTSTANGGLTDLKEASGSTN